MMANYCHVLLTSFVCLRNMQKKNKINVCISSTLVIVSLVSYRSHYGTNDLKNETPNRLNSWPTAPPYIDKHSHETPMSFLCYTNDPDTLRTWKRNSKLFSAQISKTESVFLYIDRNIKDILNIDHLPFQRHCFSRNDTFLYHCCGYSPYLEARVNHVTINESNFNYVRRVVPDNFIRIEDILIGKPEMVDISVKVSIITEHQTKTEISVQHRCRGDVLVDPYPEIHINVDRNFVNGHNMKNEFHWFL